MPSLSVKVTVIIPNWNGGNWLDDCLNALKSQDFSGFEVLVVDDASTDGSSDHLEERFPGVRVLRLTEHHGFAKTVNAGVMVTSGDYVVLLNNDTVPSISFIRNLVHAMDTMPPEVGSLASCMRSMDNPMLLDDTGDIFTWYGHALKRGHGRTVIEFKRENEILSACAGAALYRRVFLNEVGGFDEKFVSYLEDLDLGLRGRLLGYKCMFVASADVLHKGHGSNLALRDYIRFVTRNRLMLIGKNIPRSLLVRHFHHLLIGQLALFIQYRHPFDSVMGYLSFLRQIPHVLHERHRILAAKILSDQEIDRLLDPSPEGVYLPRWILERMRRGYH
ncbi:MAG: glycosyltransferase family 2 protein [Methanotrichaceae archaeon]|nr:glycosyltransferase family 2 protein [Methanotrichaceae archaeon]